MTNAYPVIETIKRRRSVRTYENQHLDPSTIDNIKQYITTLSNPFGADVKISMIDSATDYRGEKLGTYGVIKGASTFLGLSVKPADKALLGGGYAFEDLILYATSLGLGTVWLAATFSRDKFQKAMDIPTDYLFPAISPVGYPSNKRFLERVMRKTIGADSRKPWKEIFFNQNFSTPLTEEEAGKYGMAFEMMRLAPSATNAQPWRVLKDGNVFHFFVFHKTNIREEDAQIKQVDMGIGIFHFVRTLQSEGIEGSFMDTLPQLSVLPKDYHYVVSFSANN